MGAEILCYSIGLGLLVGLVFTEFFGIACGGLVVPGYIALHLTQPLDVIVTVLLAFFAFVIVKVFSMFMILYGRRRTSLMILIGFILSMIAREQTWAFSDNTSFIIGFIIPGLIAVWMDRQGITQTLASLFTASVIVRLILILTLSTEVLK